MNLASWIILAIVIAVVALAVRATFFKRGKRGGCCDAGHVDERPDMPACAGCAMSGCEGCPSRQGSAVSRNALVPTIREDTGRTGDSS